MYFNFYIDTNGKMKTNFVYDELESIMTPMKLKFCKNFTRMDYVY